MLRTFSAFVTSLRARSLQELAPFALFALTAAMIAVFGKVAGEVMGGETRSFDEALLRALRDPSDLADPIGPAWLEHVVRDVTSLGSFTVVSVVTLVAIGYLLIDGKRAAAAFVFIAIASGVALSEGLKHLFARPRPELVAHLVEVQTASFPSGHAMLSAVTFLTLGALLARIQSRRRLKAYVISVAILLTLLIGASRVYLGVHWPTDVLAGWCAGAAWAMGCWLLATWLQSRGRIEKPDSNNTPADRG
ncbi:phosphatase PAP2 family protein [Pseudorhodoplanes sp.]|uniref:phosphatase PAP2 family protein n=1 Tax=Pseudorhodoplanes sp. TaxID=1934341 RepID=UPI002BD580B4|nr:phosphatase PAP2 family protein [Pseudorhodoplanes sp.]HWV52464.1 phosphatase PAP2 family protein [Pseudorhodoplanes sp.]